MIARLARLSTAIALLLCPALLAQGPLATSFTYQGELRTSGNPATGLHDLRFRLYDAPTGGTQLGSTLCADNVALSAGRFTIQLDFGAQFAGQQRFLEIDVRQDTGLDCSNAAGFTLLSPRQSLTAAPNATYAAAAGNATNATSAGNAAQLNGQSASFYQNAGNLTSGAIPDARLVGPYTGALTLNNAGNSFAGSGAGLTALNASSLASGTIDPARLPVPLALIGSSPTFIIQGANAAADTNSVAVSGLASAATGFTNGVLGQSNSPSGNGVYGLASATSGQAWGVYGQCNSPAGLGGYFTGPGDAMWAVTPGIGYSCVVAIHSGSGDGYGLYGQTNGTTGAGVFGRVYSTTGPTLGGLFTNYSTSGNGAAAYAYATSGSTLGLYGESDSTAGTGVKGYVNAATGTTYGVLGQSDSASGTGVYGLAQASTGSGLGVRGDSNAPGGRGVRGWAVGTSGIGVEGHAFSATGGTMGIYGASDSTSGTGVSGSASANTGNTFGVSGLTSSPTGVGVYGEAGSGTGANYGVQGLTQSVSGAGVYGYAPSFTGTTYGGLFTNNSSSGTGVRGRATASTGNTSGVSGQSDSSSGYGVFGFASGTGGSYGGYFTSAGSSGAGVAGSSSSSSGPAAGVYGSASSTSGIGVSGQSIAASGATYGGYFRSWSTSGYGVYGYASAASGQTYGVLGQANPNGWAVFSMGDMGASGLKPFRIDHPEDPENKYLLHYASESPEVINFYRGTVILDGAGGATVDLPAYFARINKTPSYQLTAIGAPMPLLHIAREIEESALTLGAAAEPSQSVPTCSFRIAGGAPGGKVSWRVEALRNDRWAQQHGAPVEVEKEGAERGTYQHPDLYHQPPEKGMNYRADRDKPLLKVPAAESSVPAPH